MSTPPISYNAGGTVTMPGKELEGLPEYTYSGLPHARSIRILELLLESARSIPKFKVQFYGRSSNPLAFDALSYTWGYC